MSEEVSGSSLPVQRLRVRYAKGEALKYISHLDVARSWERAFRRAGLPLAYSQGFNPRPRFQIAAALPRRRLHKGSWQAYDLRPLVQEIEGEAGPDGSAVLCLRLQASQAGAGRPEEVLDTLGLSPAPHCVERTALHFEYQSDRLPKPCETLAV